MEPGGVEPPSENHKACEHKNLRQHRNGAHHNWDDLIFTSIPDQ